MNDLGFRKLIERKAKRMAEGRSKKGRLWAGLGLVGSLGWIVALPTAAGTLIGRHLDERLATFPNFTLSLMLIGLGTGIYAVWRFFLRDLT